MTMRGEVAVIGGGIMGTDIAALLAAGGVEVHLVVRTTRGRAMLDARLLKALSALGNTDAASRISVVSDLRKIPWLRLSLAIESVTEDLAAKRDVFTQLSALSKKDTWLTSNSSAIPISQIGDGMEGRERMFNLHFFMPAHLVPLVEVVCGEQSDPAIAQRLCDLMTSVGKHPVLVRRDLPGFLANRLQHALMREAWSLVDRGIVSAADVDTAVRFGFGFRYVAAGPMLQKDLSGLKVHFDSACGVYPSLCNDAAPAATLREMVARGELGVSSGKGSFAWTPQQIAIEQGRYLRALARAQAILNEE